MSSATDARIARERTRLVDEWRECCRIPSVSGASEATASMAAWLVERLGRVFPIVERIPLEDQPPVILAELPGAGARKLLVYTHYDVQPPGDETLWSSPPFEAAVRGDAVYARGSCDDKADITARVQALELWLDELREPPPFTVVWLSEGAEEIGSPGLDAVIARHRDRLHADGCLWESFVRHADGRAEIGFGCRGLLRVELAVRLLPADQHVAFSPVLRSASVYLTRALASLVDEHGTVLLDGFSDAVAPPTGAEAAMAEEVEPPRLGIEDGWQPYLDLDDRELGRRLVFTPTLTISTILAGDTGGASAVTAAARATLAFSLVPDQDPDDVLALLRRHLEARGFGEIDVTLLNAIRPARGSVDDPVAQAAIGAARDVFGPPILYPLLPGAGPGRLFVEELGTPIVSPAGTTRLDSGIHAPDEHGSISDYLEHVRFTVRFLERFADRRPTPRAPVDS